MSEHPPSPINPSLLRWLPPGLFALCLALLLRTMLPTLHSFDSAEFVIGAYGLYMVHAPGYSLYLLLAHLFTYLPIGDVAFRVNLLSVLALAGVAPLLYLWLRGLRLRLSVAVAVTLLLLWSEYVWSVGLAAEVYAPQLFMLALLGLLLVKLLAQDTPSPAAALRIGALFGLAVGMTPQSALFAPGLLLAFLLVRLPWRWRILAGLLSLGIFLLSLLYFPLRYDPAAPFSIAGEYNAAGVFEPVNLRSAEGLWWMVSGQQFNALQRQQLPKPHDLQRVAGYFSANFLVLGAVLGLPGLWLFWQRARRFFWVWLGLLLPFLAYYLNYPAGDVYLMLAPAYLLWALPLAFGLSWATDDLPRLLRLGLLLALPLLFLLANFPRLDHYGNSSTRDLAQQRLDALPPNAQFMGAWFDIMPMQYLQVVEGQRPDVQLYNLFLFPAEARLPYGQALLAEGGALYHLEGLTPLPVQDSQYRMSAPLKPDLGLYAQVQALHLPPGFQSSLFATPPLEGDPFAQATVLLPHRDSFYLLTLGGKLFHISALGELRLIFEDSQNQVQEARGLALHEGVFYLSHAGRISSLTDSDGDGGLDSLTPIVEGLPSGEYPFHSNNGILFDAAGWLYVGVGATTDHGPLRDPLEAAVLRLRPDGSGLEVFASGLRNPYDLTLTPEGALFTADNNPDQLDDSLRDYPPEELNHLRAGADYGFPDVFGFPPAGHPSTPPVVEFLPSVASAGLSYCHCADFPAPYQQGIFVAQFGAAASEALRQAGHGRALEFVALTLEAGGTYSGEVQPFLKVHPLLVDFRPVDVAVGADGGLYLLEYATGAVYRIRYVGE